MRDLLAVDRQLSELAEKAAPDVRELLDRILGSDRSLARLNELLESIGVPSNGTSPRIAAPAPSPLRDPLAPAARGGTLRPPAAAFAPAANGEARVPRSDAPPPTRANPPGVRGSLPPRIVSPLAPVQGDSLKTATPWPPVQASAPARARDTLVDAAVPPPAPPPGPLPAAAVPALAVAAAAPAPAPAPVPAPAPAPPSVDEVELDAATAALFGVTMPPAGQALQDSIPMPAPLPPLAAEASEPAPDSTREGRAAMRELLDREIDPSDFPSSHPPRAMRSIPPPLPKPPAGQESFEMLIDDEGDDIMEIDDVELEEIE